MLQARRFRIAAPWKARPADLIAPTFPQTQKSLACVLLLMVSLQIEELPPVVREDVEDFLEMHPRSPAAQLRPKLGVVGSVWLAYIGPKLQRASSGLGTTPRHALEDFNLRFMELLISRNGFRRE